MTTLLQRWRSMWGRGDAPAAAGLDDARWIVADVESGGLDPRRDPLLAIAAVGVHFAPVQGDRGERRPRVMLGDSFELLLRPPGASTAPPDKDNILVHGIGIGTQRAGIEPAEALQAWERYIGRSPLVGFHSAFDRTLIDRAGRDTLGRAPPNPWLDLEHLAAVLHREPRRRSLDDWLAQHGITCLARHQAAADALATAQLLLKLWPALRQRCDGRFTEVLDLAAGHRFLPLRR
jgi:DNA polymerase-3 subunit epsilon